MVNLVGNTATASEWLVFSQNMLHGKCPKIAIWIHESMICICYYIRIFYQCSLVLGGKSTLRQTIIIFNMYKHSDLHNNTGNVKIQYQSHTGAKEKNC